MARQEEHLKERLVRGSFLLLFSRLYFAFTSYLTLIAVARLLGAASFGDYILVSTLVFWLEVITGQAFEQPLIYESASRGPKAVRGLIMRQLSWSLFATILVLVGCNAIGVLAHRPTIVPILAVAAFDILPFSFFLTGKALLNARHQYRSMMLATIVYSTVKFISMLALAYVFRSAASVMGGMVAASVVAAIYVWMVQARESSTDSIGVGEKLGLSNHGLFSSILMSASRAFLLVGDVWLVQLSAPYASLSGPYGVAQNLSKALYLVSTALVAPILPKLVGEHSLRELYQTHADVRRLIQLLVCSLFAGSLILALGARPLVRVLFGEEFSEGATFLSTLAPATAILILGISSTQVLFQFNERRLAALSSVISTFSFLLIGCFLGRLAGPQGVILSLAIAGGLQLAIFLVVTERKGSRNR